MAETASNVGRAAGANPAAPLTWGTGRAEAQAPGPMRPIRETDALV